jgi:2-haloacid dehalogenase
MQDDWRSPRVMAHGTCQKSMGSTPLGPTTAPETTSTPLGPTTAPERRASPPGPTTPAARGTTSGPAPAGHADEAHAASGTAVSARQPAVVFDIGNVLIRWDPHPAVAAEVGEEEAARFLTAQDFDFLAWNHAQDSGRSWSDGEHDLARSHPHWHRHGLAYRRNFDLSLLGPLEDNVSVLHDLARAGVPLFGLTNWSAELFPRALERFDFLRLFSDIVVSGVEGVAKPDPAVFDVLAGRVGRPLADCVFVDDSPANVAAAAAAGMDAIRFSPDEPLRPSLRDRGLPV